MPQFLRCVSCRRSPLETVLGIEEIHAAGIAGLLNELSREQVRIAHENVLVAAQLEVVDEVDFVADVMSGPPCRVLAKRHTEFGIEGVPRLVEVEKMRLNARLAKDRVCLRLIGRPVRKCVQAQRTMPNQRRPRPR